MMHRKFTMVLAVFFALLTFSACGKAASDASEPSSDASSSVSSGVSAETSSETGSEGSSSEVSSEEASSEESSEESSAETSSAESSAESSAASTSSKPASSKPSSTASSKPSSTASSRPSSKPSESSSASSAESSSESYSEPSSESSSASSSVSASDIYSAIDAAFRSKYGDGPIVNSPYSVDDTSLTELFHLNSDQVESYCGMMAGMMTNCDELLVVQAKDGKVNEVKAALEQRLSEQKDSFAHYPVMFNDVRLDDAKVVVKGNYVALLIVGVITDEINEAGEADFTGDVEMAENAFYSAID